MRFNLFASSLIVALSSAISMEAADLVGDLDDNELVAAQIGASVEWTSDGTHKSEYKRPQDHCCWLYVDGSRESRGFKTALQEFCYEKYDEKTGKAPQGQVMEPEKAITGIDCGKNTWITLLASDTGAVQNLAGRTIFDVAYYT